MRQRRCTYTCALLLVAAATAFTCAAAGADALVFFEVAPPEGEDTDIYGQRIATDGTLPWGDAESPTIVGTSPHRETSPAACEDGAGGAIVVYELTFLEGEHAGDTDLVAQRVGGDGTRLWNDGETPKAVASSKGREGNAAILSDGAGGAFVVYEWIDEGDDSDILAQRIGPDGETLWNDGDKPAILGASELPERNPVVVSDGAGGIIVIFEWVGEGDNIDVMAQRVTADGTVLWNDGVQAMDVSATGEAERGIAAVSDGEGGALVAFELAFLDGKDMGDVDIMAQRISGEGVRLWNGGTEPVTVSSGVGVERGAQAVADGAGGMVVVFEYEPLEGEHAGDIDILGQRLSANGTALWNEGEKSSIVSTSPQLERTVVALSDGRGGALVLCEQEFRAGEHGGDIDVVGQHLLADGSIEWEAGERSRLIAASEWLERAPLVVPDGEGGVIVVMPAVGAEGKYEGDEDILAARLTPDGELLWEGGERSVPVAGSGLLERHPTAVTVP